jgi:hypothetical protein
MGSAAAAGSWFSAVMVASREVVNRNDAEDGVTTPRIYTRGTTSMRKQITLQGEDITNQIESKYKEDTSNKIKLQRRIVEISISHIMLRS